MAFSSQKLRFIVTSQSKIVFSKSAVRMTFYRGLLKNSSTNLSLLVHDPRSGYTKPEKLKID